jgi:hypothetical protein
MTKIFINNRNRVTYPKQMVNYLIDLPYSETIIIDQASTYPPLLQWYDEECPVRVIRMDRNLGHQGPWKAGIIEAEAIGYYVVTDPDLDLTGVPLDVLDVLKRGFNKYPQAMKAGLSLEIEDLPDNEQSRAVRGWERQFWQNHDGDGFYIAAVDTTFALYHKLRTSFFLSAVRAERPYTARHLPWYLGKNDIDEEEEYYIKNVQTVTHWATFNTR